MTLDELTAFVPTCPPGTLILVATVAEALADRHESRTLPDNTAQVGTSETWREKLWTVPAETRIGVDQLCEALDRPRSFVYRHTSRKSGLPQIPHRKLDGQLVFVAGECRAWIERNEVTIVAGPPAPLSFPFRRQA